MEVHHHYTRRSTSLSSPATAFFNQADDPDHKSMASPPPHHGRLSLQSHYDHHHDNLLFSPTRSPNTVYGPSSSPWVLSPHRSHPTPSPSILYHCVAALHRHHGLVLSVSPCPSSGIVFTGSDSPRVRAWLHPHLCELGHLSSRHGGVRSLLSHGTTLFTSHRDLRIRVWDFSHSSPHAFRAKKTATLPKPRSIFSFPTTSRANGGRHRDHISGMAYNHAEGLLYTGSWDKTVKAWRISDGRCVDSFRAHDDRVNAVVVGQEDGCVFTCSSDGSVKVWRRVYGQSSHTLTVTLRFQPSPVNALALAGGTSRFLYSGSSDGFINFWEREGGSGRFCHGGFLQGHRFAVLCLAAVEQMVFSGSEDTTVRVWRRWEEGSCLHECLAVVDAHRGPVRCLAAVLEVEKVVVMGFLLYSAGLDQTFKVWRVKVLPEGEEDGGKLVGGCPEGGGKVVAAAEYEMSPVLSPSWVEKKLQGGDNPFSLN